MWYVQKRKQQEKMAQRSKVGCREVIKVKMFKRLQSEIEAGRCPCDVIDKQTGRGRKAWNYILQLFFSSSSALQALHEHTPISVSRCLTYQNLSGRFYYMVFDGLDQFS